MAPDEIKLTPQELEDIKDDIKFKQSTTLFLKSLHKKTDMIEETHRTFTVDITSLKVHRGIQWWFIGGVSLSLLTMAFVIIRTGLIK